MGPILLPLGLLVGGAAAYVIRRLAGRPTDAAPAPALPSATAPAPSSTAAPKPAPTPAPTPAPASTVKPAPVPAAKKPDAPPEKVIDLDEYERGRAAAQADAAQAKAAAEAEAKAKADAEKKAKADAEAATAKRQDTAQSARNAVLAECLTKGGNAVDENGKCYKGDTVLAGLLDALPSLDAASSASEALTATLPPLTGADFLERANAAATPEARAAERDRVAAHKAARSGWTTDGTETGDAIPADIAAALSLAAGEAPAETAGDDAAETCEDCGGVCCAADLTAGLPDLDDGTGNAATNVSTALLAAAAPTAAIPVVGPFAAAAAAIGGGITSFFAGKSDAEKKADKAKAAAAKVAEKKKIAKACSPCEKKRRAAAAALERAQKALLDAQAQRDTATQRGAVSDSQAQADRAAIDRFNASLPHWPWTTVQTPTAPTPGPVPALPAAPAHR